MMGLRSASLCAASIREGHRPRILFRNPDPKKSINILKLRVNDAQTIIFSGSKIRR